MPYGKARVEGTRSKSVYGVPKWWKTLVAEKITGVRHGGPTGYEGTRRTRFSSELAVFPVHICSELLIKSFLVYNNIQYERETVEFGVLMLICVILANNFAVPEVSGEWQFL